MHTELSDEFRQSRDGQDARAIIKSCVHCGFCNASCPTYQVLGDELDGPRGRIYQIKMTLEGKAPTRLTQLHLDRCLLCRACESACPSAVRYGDLLEIGRRLVETRLPRPWPARSGRWLLRQMLARRRVFKILFSVAKRVRRLLPEALRAATPRVEALPDREQATSEDLSLPRRMLVLDGCVQPTLAPRTNVAATRLLARFGIRLQSVPGAGCCGGLALHTSGEDEGKTAARKLMECWEGALDGAEGIISTASGCGLVIRGWPQLFRDEPAWRARAERISTLCRDISEVVSAEYAKTGVTLRPRGAPRRVAFHAPCTLRHGLRLDGGVEKILRAVGHTLCEIKEPQLCCGSAGTYSLLQPALAGELRRRKIAALCRDHPEVIATANVGCQNHLRAATDIPLVHWLELVA